MTIVISAGHFALGVSSFLWVAQAFSHSEGEVGIDGVSVAACTSAQQLFQRLLPPEFFLERREWEQLRRNTAADNNPVDWNPSKRKPTLRVNNRVYNDSVVLWLMIVQRLKGGGTMEDAVMELLRGLPVKVNLIPMNPIEASTLGPPDLAGVLAFQRILVEAGYSCFIRRRRGDDVSAACGQLALLGAKPKVRVNRT